MTDAEKQAERIKSLPLDPEYKHDPSIPIPLGRGVLVKKIEKKVQAITGTGIMIMSSDNTPEPHIGIIQTVGPLCSEYLRIGLRCYYNFFVDSTFYHNGVHYAKMDENDVYYLIPPETALFESVKPEAYVRREKKHADQDSYIVRKHAHDQEEKNKKEIQKKSGKTTIILKK